MVHELFEEQVERTPEAVAVVYEDQALTYVGLNSKANQLARYLRERGVGAGSSSGVCVDRGLDMVTGLLGVPKAGGAYLPLDPAIQRNDWLTCWRMQRRGAADSRAPESATSGGPR